MSIFSILQGTGAATTGQSVGPSSIVGTALKVGNNRLGSGSSAAANVTATLENAKFNANNERIMAAVALRIQGIAEGTIQPQEVWEKVAGYLTLTGQPFTYSVDSGGQIEITPQDPDEPGAIPPGEREALEPVLRRLAEVRQAADEVNTKTNLRGLLQFAVARVDEMTLQAPAIEQWERDFQVIKGTGRPVLIGLGPTGDLRAINQLDSNFDYVEDETKRLILQQAGRDLKNILDGVSSATEDWQYEALGNKLEGDDYFLDVDENNEVVVRRNRDRRGVSAVLPLFQQSDRNDFHIIPEFLNPTDADNRIFREQWERDVVALIQAKKPFHLEVVGGRVVVRETDFATARR